MTLPILSAQSERRERRARFALRAGLIAILLTSAPLDAFASGERNDTASEQQRARAKARYEQGVEAYSSGRYADAVRLFLEADAISPSAALSYNIARAYEKLSDDAQTLRWYRNYLRLNPQASNASEVQRFERTLSEALAKKGIQQVTVLSTPLGATVAIDSRALGVTPLTVELRPGAHSALVTLRGYRDRVSNFTLPADVPIDVSVELSPAPPNPNTATNTQHDPESRERRFGIAPWITLGAAAVALGAAAGFELARRSAQSDAKDEQVQLAYDSDFDAMNSRQTTARVLLGVGGALALGGAALLVLNTPVSRESHASVSAVPGGATLAWEHQF